MTEAVSGRFDRMLVEPGLKLAGRVRAVHAHAATVAGAAERLHPELGLLTLLAPGRALVPGGIEIPWERARPEAGDPVVLQQGLLRIGERIRVQLRGDGAPLRIPRLPFSASVLRAQLEALRWPARTRSLLARPVPTAPEGPRPGAEEVLLVRLRAALDALLAALAPPAPSAAEVARRVADLAGLGPGSTPSGDDVLVGIAAAEERLGSAAQARRASLAAALAKIGAEQTTELGREMMAHAARGRYPEPLAEVAAALGDPGASLLSAKIDGLARLGAQSGCDMLAGLVAAAAAAEGCWDRLGRDRRTADPGAGPVGGMEPENPGPRREGGQA